MKSTLSIFLITLFSAVSLSQTFERATITYSDQSIEKKKYTLITVKA